jgi:perosamine synthetase
MKKQTTSDLKLLNEAEIKVPLFYPFVPEEAQSEIISTLQSRWIGQGPKVEKLEKEFQKKFLGDHLPLAVGSGTDAIHLAYLLAGVTSGDEVIVPVFTCTATNIPLLYIGAKPVFVDVLPGTLNIDPSKIEQKITEKTKAISIVHYGGLPCDMQKIQRIANKHNLLIIEDAAQAIGAKYNDKFIGEISDFTAFSFQAIKHITSGDGGLLSINDENKIAQAQRLRWFGIDREAKQGGIWENDIYEVGYKYQLTDLGACVALAGLKHFDPMFKLRKILTDKYKSHLNKFSDIKIVGEDFENQNNVVNANWLMTVFANNADELMRKLRANGYECNRVHFRNDKYTIFEEFVEDKSEFEEMDKIQDKYIVLPLHHKVTERDVENICDLIKEGW